MICVLFTQNRERQIPAAQAQEGSAGRGLGPRSSCVRFHRTRAIAHALPHTHATVIGLGTDEMTINATICSEVLTAITEDQQLAPEHMYELLVRSEFDFVHHLLKVRQCNLDLVSFEVLTDARTTRQLLQQKLRAENKLQSFLSAQQCKGPLFAFTKHTASDLSNKSAQKVLKLLFAAVKGPHDMTNDTTHDTRHTTHDTRHTTHDTRHTTHDTTRQDQRHDTR